MMSELLPLLAPPRASIMLNPTCACPVSLDHSDRCDLILGLPGLCGPCPDRAPSRGRVLRSGPELIHLLSVRSAGVLVDD